MLFKALTVGLAFTASVSAAAINLEERAACNADYCLRALRATQYPTRLPQAQSDCAVYLGYTGTGPAETVTVTAQATESVPLSTSTVWVTASRPGEGNLPLEKRATPTIPAYASPCSGQARYTSACSCIGVTGTVAPPRVTVTITATEVTVSYTATTTVTIPALQLASPTPIFGSLTGLDYTLDDERAPLTLPFPIVVYNVSSADLWVSINGYISINSASTSPGSSYDNTALPAVIGQGQAALLPTSVLALWDDLYIAARTQQGVYYEITGMEGSRTVTFEWLTTAYQRPAEFYHFTMSYTENVPGVFNVKYYEVYQGGFSATIGVQNAPEQFVQWSFNTANSVQVGTVLKIDTKTNKITQPI